MMSPVSAQAVDRPSEVQRRVLCSHYSECLDICLSRGWPGFSCSQCRDFDFECPDDPVHWAEQSKNSGRLLLNAGYFPKWIVDRVKNRSDAREILRELSV